ncbi:MAG: flagellum-specific ATP synthase FliI [Pseudomonadota bacterium]
MSVVELPRSARIWGTVTGTDGTSIRLGGLARLAKLGDRVEVDTGGERIAAEIVAIDGLDMTALLMAAPRGLSAGQRAWLVPDPDPNPSDRWLGQVLDAYGRTGDGAPNAIMARTDAKRSAPDPGGMRRPLGPRLTTGLAALDTFLPLCRGQRLGVFAGSGVGKSRLMADLALGIMADVVVIGLIGERSREVGDFVRLLTQAGGMDRTVVIAASSDQPALYKRRAAALTLKTAEHFRDQGRHVLCLLDSVTRYAEAHREIALAAGEAPALRAFPPSTTPMIADLCERAGPGVAGDAGGDITAVFTVLVAGSDMDEPVADMVRGVLDGHVILDRAIAERGRFPAIDMRKSVSRSAPAAWTADEEALVMHARRLIAAREEAAPMIQAGLYAPGADPVLDDAVRLWPDLDGFVGSITRGQSSTENFARLAEILAQSEDGAASGAPRAN